MEHIINSNQSLEAYKKYLDSQFEQKKYLRVSLKTGQQRTLTQNAALNVFCRQLADCLNDAGFDFRVFIADGYPVPFTQDLVKEHMWRPIQRALTGHDSTTKPKTDEYPKIYDVLNSKLAEHGVYVPWPSKESMNDG